MWIWKRVNLLRALERRRVKFIGQKINVLILLKVGYLVRENEEGQEKLYLEYINPIVFHNGKFCDMEVVALVRREWLRLQGCI